MWGVNNGRREITKKLPIVIKVPRMIVIVCKQLSLLLRLAGSLQDFSELLVC